MTWWHAYLIGMVLTAVIASRHGGFRMNQPRSEKALEVGMVAFWPITAVLFVWFWWSES